MCLEAQYAPPRRKRRINWLIGVGAEFQNLWVDAYANSAATLAQHKREYEVLKGVLGEIDIEK